MGGDLNLKKSWHPALIKNQQRTWNEEQKALQERKKIEQLRRERAEEAQIEELQKMQEAAGGTQRLKRLDWMYNGPGADRNGISQEQESYLLGKRRVDGLLLKQNDVEDNAASSRSMTPMQDAMVKISDDPLLLMKKQEQKALAAILKDPVKMRKMSKHAIRDAHDHESTKRERGKHHSYSSADHKHTHRSSRHSSQHSKNYEHSSHAESSSYHNPRGPGYRVQKREKNRHSASHSSAPHSPIRSHRTNSVPIQEIHTSPPGSNKIEQSKAQQSDMGSSPMEAKVRSQDDREAKLAAMSDAAIQLDRERKERLELVERQEAQNLKADDNARERSSNRGKFLLEVNGKALGQDLRTRIQASHRNLTLDLD